MRRSTLLLMGLTALGAGCSSHACTLIGCQSQASIAIRRADGAPPAFDLLVTLDGRTVTCPATSVGSACAPDVTLLSREISECAEDVTGSRKTLHCTGTGRFEEVLQVVGTPAMIAVALRSAGAPVAERTFSPQYATSRPNGPDCEPVCQQSWEVWTLP